MPRPLARSFTPEGAPVKLRRILLTLAVSAMAGAGAVEPEAIFDQPDAPAAFQARIR